ncbi:hypothetical protein PMNALOAF_2393 [Methylobacterium adhaesivum]|nr:hypothetical protein PMNALOAF_2393 [Methylobacterium adhaesivum]
MSVNRKSAKEDFELSLNHGVDVKGHAELMEASRNGDFEGMGHVIEAFRMRQRDIHKLANFRRCAYNNGK